MAPSPIVVATVQTAVINAVSNILAQAIAAHQASKPLEIDWIPPFQYLLFGLLSTPPNFLWQDLLETSFPAYRPHPDSEADGDGDDEQSKQKEKKKKQAGSKERRLSKRNTLAKTVLDQTVGAAANTLLFSLFMHSMRDAMAPRHHRHVGDGGGVPVLALRYADVDWAVVWAKARGEFWGLVRASWRFWPLVSLVNYVFLTSVGARSLLGSLAGLVWGIYISLYTGQ